MIFGGTSNIDEIIDGMTVKRRNLGLIDYNKDARLKELTCVVVDEGRAFNTYHYCNEQFGDNWIWSAPIQADYVEFYFLHKEDALIFKLTLGGR